MDFSNLKGGEGMESLESEGGKGEGLEGGSLEGGLEGGDKKSNALYELEKCLSRIQTFAERKAHQVVKNCAASYNARVVKYDGVN